MKFLIPFIIGFLTAFVFNRYIEVPIWVELLAAVLLGTIIYFVTKKKTKN